MKATDPNWQNEARRLIAEKSHFVVIEISPSAYNDCIALAQEHDYDCLVEGKDEERGVAVKSFPRVLPQKLGFVPEGYMRMKG